jgi:hypothetical protein
VDLDPGAFHHVILGLSALKSVRVDTLLYISEYVTQIVLPNLYLIAFGKIVAGII